MRAMSPLPELRIHIPHYYRCPISLDLMRDPVTLCTGQTYDRSSIEKWIADGNLTCPVTRQPLRDLTLTPNHMLIRLIQTWCVQNKSYGIERIPTPKQPASPRQLTSLARDISSLHGSKHEKVEALRRIRSLAKDSEKNRRLMSELGLVSILIEAVFGEDGVEEALGALALLPLTEVDREALAQPKRLQILSNLLRFSTMDVRVNVGSLVESLTASEEASDNIRTIVGAAEGMLDGLVSLIRESHFSRAVRVGIRALFAMCLSSSNRGRAVESGAAPALIESLLKVEKSDKERVLATMELLCKTAEGREAVGGHALAIPVLQKMILKVSDQASENAAGTLLTICANSEKVQEEALREGVFTQILLLLQSECSCRAKKKARCLLKLLRDSWPDHPCIRALGRTDVVPF